MEESTDNADYLEAPNSFNTVGHTAKVKKMMRLVELRNTTSLKQTIMTP